MAPLQFVFDALVAGLVADYFTCHILLLTNKFHVTNLTLLASTLHPTYPTRGFVSPAVVSETKILNIGRGHAKAMHTAHAAYTLIDACRVCCVLGHLLP